MKYDHRVKVDGKWFEAGVEIDATTPKAEPKAEPVKEVSPSYTRTQIQQMNRAELTATCDKLGIEYDEEKTGKDLKQLILAKLEL